MCCEQMHWDTYDQKMYVGLKLTIPCPAQRSHAQVVLAPTACGATRVRGVDAGQGCVINVASCLKDEKTLDLDNGRIQGTFRQ